MRKQIATKSALCLALLAGAAALASAPASAQPYEAYSAGPNETVTVTAPRFREQTSPLNGPMEPVSYSLPVRYTFRDLVEPGGMHALRGRVWRTAEEVCGRLADAYPVYTSTTSRSCLHDAYFDAMAKLDARATGARLAYYYGY